MLKHEKAPCSPESFANWVEQLAGDFRAKGRDAMRKVFQLRTSRAEEVSVAGDKFVAPQLRLLANGYGLLSKSLLLTFHVLFTLRIDFG